MVICGVGVGVGCLGVVGKDVLCGFRISRAIFGFS